LLIEINVAADGTKECVQTIIVPGGKQETTAIKKMASTESKAARHGH
jgi:hypothetical protein